MIESDITVDTKYHIPGSFLGRSLLSKADHSGCNRQTAEFTRLTNGREGVVEASTSHLRGYLFIWKGLLDGGDTQEAYYVVSDIEQKDAFSNTQTYKVLEQNNQREK